MEAAVRRAQLAISHLIDGDDKGYHVCTQAVTASVECFIMPNWVAPVLVLVIGSGGVAGLIAPLVNHWLQQRRESERAQREARTVWVANQRELCLALLDVVIRMRTFLLNMRSLHDDLASRHAAKATLKLLMPQLPATEEAVRRFRRELDLEPNAQLQESIERWGDAAVAYQQALMRPLSSWWNPVRFFMGKTPAAEVNRLATEFDARTQELQNTVREYTTRLASAEIAKPSRKPTKQLWQRWLRTPTS